MKQQIKYEKLRLAAHCGIALALSHLFVGGAWADVSPSSDAARLAALEKDMAQMHASQHSSPTSTGLPLHGFADVDYTRSSKADTHLNQSGRGFSVNALDFYLTPQFGDQVKSLFELNFEFDSEGGLATDIERAQIGYTVNDQLTAWMGRFHTPIGNWNTAFHHGANIQTSVYRPRFADFEDKGGVLPSHTVGAWATGATPLANGKLTYDFYVGNGNEIQTDASNKGTTIINNSRDSNGNSMVGGNLGYKFSGRLSGLHLGLHAFNERVNITDTVTPATVGEVTVSMSGFYGVYDQNDWEVFAEYYHFNDKNLTGASGSNSSWASFVQIGRTLGDDWTPYARLEKATLDQRDLYFNSQVYGTSYVRQAVGVRYTVNIKTAIKLELNHTKEGDGIPLSGPGSGQFSQARFQYSILF